MTQITSALPRQPSRRSVAGVWTIASLAVLTGTRAFGQAVNPSDNLSLRFADGIVAIAESDVITVDDVRREVAPYIAQMQREAHNQEDFNRKFESLQDDIIQGLIDKVLIIKEFAKDDKRHLPQSIIDEQMAQRLNDQFDNDRSKFLAYLRSHGQTIKDYRMEVAKDVIYHYMLSQERKSQSTVSPVRILQYYKENKDQFYQEDSIDMRLIELTHANGDSDATLMAKADAILQRFRAGEKFEDLAKEFSDDARRSRGGDWGWQKRTGLKAEFSDPLFALKKGEATQPILNSDGCFILYAEDRKYAGIQPLDQVRDQIERILIQQTTSEALVHWKERLRRGGYVKHF